MECPCCQFALADQTVECPRCGVVVSRYRPRVARPQPLAADPSRAARFPIGAALVVLVVLAGATGYLVSRSATRDEASPAIGMPEPSGEEERSAEGFEPEAPAITAPAHELPLTELPAQIDDSDRTLATRLAAAIRERRIDDGDVGAAEDLLARHPDDPGIVELAEAVFLRVAQRHGSARPQAAIAVLERGTRALPASFAIVLMLAQSQVAAKLWPAAEATSRRAIDLKRDSPEAHYVLGFTLMRQDRDREAADALEASLQLRDDAQTRALLDQVRHARATQAGMTEQKLSHFHLRYDGDSHEIIGREVLRVLDRHYVTLVQTFRHELETVVPVILYTTRNYYDATGAPAWSGGAYSHLDGRISLPIGGVGSSLPADADRALIHELAHAFIHDMGGESVPRQIHEGIAQLVEGERCEGGRVSGPELASILSGRRNDVVAFYVASLCLVEDLHRERGQSGLNDFLLSLRETRNPEASFERIYGRTYSAYVTSWQASMKQRYGR